MKDCKISTPVGVFLLVLIFGFSMAVVSAQEIPAHETSQPGLVSGVQTTPPPTPSPQIPKKEEATIEEMPSPSPSPELSKQEMNDFKREMKDLGTQASQLLKDLKKTKGTEEWQKSIQEVITGAKDCSTKLASIPADDRRSHIDDCRGQGFWDTLNEIREEFVPPQDIKNAFNDIKRQTKELEKFKKQLLKAASGSDTKTIDDLLTQIAGHKTSIETSKGRDQRDALNEFWGSNYWEEVNKVRFRVELPKQLKDLAKELKFLDKDLGSRSVTKAFEFFGIGMDTVKKLLESKKSTMTQMQTLVDQGNYDQAGEILEEDVHQGWHPGDLRHFVGMMRETSDRMKSVKDEAIKDQILTIIDPIVASLNEGDVRGAKEAMIEFTEQMRKYESLFRPYYQGGTRRADKKTQGALDKLEQLINEKIKKGELKDEAQEQELDGDSASN